MAAGGLTSCEGSSLVDNVVMRLTSNCVSLLPNTNASPATELLM